MTGDKAQIKNSTYCDTPGRTGRHFTGETEKICPENNNLP